MKIKIQYFLSRYITLWYDCAPLVKLNNIKCKSNCELINLYYTPIIATMKEDTFIYFTTKRICIAEGHSLLSLNV